MTANFRDFEADYHSHINSIQKDIVTLQDSLNNQQKRDQGVIFNRGDIVKRLQDNHGHIKEAIALMELESNEGTAEQRAQCKLRLAEMKRESFRLEKDINGLKQQSLAADRADLLKRVQISSAASSSAGGGKDGNHGASPSAMTKTDAQLAEMTNNTKTMHKSTTTLKHALQYAVRMNEHGEAVIVELKKQDETINRIAGTTADTDNTMTSTQRVLRDMRLAAMKNQALLSGVVIVLVVMIVALLYFEYARPSSITVPSSSPTGNTGGSSGSGVSPPSVINSPVRPPQAATGSSAASSGFLGALDGFGNAPAGVKLRLQPLLP